MSTQPPQFPLPPDGISTAGHVQREWEAIIKDSRLGRFYQGRVQGLEEFLEFRRGQIDRDELNAQYDWELDWRIARGQHLFWVDQAAWWQSLRDRLEGYWTAHAKAQVSYINAVGVEGMKAILLIHGAMALAALAVLTGQIAEPMGNVRLAAKLALCASLLGLTMAALGQLALFHFGAEAAGRIQSALAARTRLRRVYALSRYYRRFVFPRMQLVNALIYGSVFVFVAGAIASAIVILSEDV